MESHEQLQLMLAEIGPELNVQGVLQVEDGRWALIYDEQRIVEIAHRLDRKCLNISMELGEPKPEKQLETYRNLLAYSALDEQTGGVRIALDSPYGSLLQLLDLFTEDLDGVTLIGVLENFFEKAELWRSLLAEGGISSNEVSEQETSDTSGGIRV